MQSTATTDSFRALTGPVWRAWQRHRVLAVLVLMHAVLSMVLKQAMAPEVKGEGFAAMAWSFAAMLPLMIYLGLGLRVLAMMRSELPDGRKAWLIRDLRGVIDDRDRLADTGLALVLIIVFLASFAQMKGLITAFQPFSWDVAFANLDQALHLGTAPWEAAHALLGAPVVITLMTGAYNFWLSLAMFILFFACFARKDPTLRLQFLLAFVLTWAIGGNLLATVFSSAGPVYYERLGLGQDFAPLMALLAQHAGQAPVSVLPVQDWLWGLYVRPDGLKGISAFPSIHVATSVLMALYGFRLGRVAGWALAGFAVVIALGSVLLAWHYAVDGYAGALIALACWWVAGRIARPARA